MKDWMSRKVRFIKSTSEQDDQKVRASVELSRPSGTFVGRAERPSQGVDVLKASAQAAAEAVQQASGVGDARVEVLDAALVKVFGADVVIVSVSAQVHGQVRSLYGVCHVDGDATEAAALAVLNATNRVYDLS